MKRGLFILALSSIPHKAPTHQKLEEPLLSAYRSRTEADKQTLLALQRQLSAFPPGERLWALGSITYLDLSGEKIQSLSPLVLLKNLRWLKIKGSYLQEEGSLSLLALKKILFIQWDECSLSLPTQETLALHLAQNRSRWGVLSKP